MEEKKAEKRVAGEKKLEAEVKRATKTHCRPSRNVLSAERCGGELGSGTLLQFQCSSHGVLALQKAPRCRGQFGN